MIFEVSQSQVEASPPHDINGWEPFSQCFHIEQIYPILPSVAQVPNLPPNVQSAFVEAEQNFTDKRMGSAAMGYRLALERALKVLFPEAKGRLYKRIEDQVGSLPPAMIDLLHEVRFLGNDGAHEEEDPTADDVASGREFVILYFTYVFDLPRRIEAAQAKRQAGKA